jgi:signal transduction histidine kinase
MRIKILLSILLGLIFYAFQGVYFKKLDIFNRDLFQYFNSPLNSKIDDRIALVDIDVNEEGFSNPLHYSEIEKLVKVISDSKPKHIIFHIEPNEYNTNEQELKKLYILLEKNKVYLNANEKTRSASVSFSDVPLFSNYPYSFNNVFCYDSDSDYISPRRMLIEFFGNGRNDKLLSSTLSKMSLPAKETNYFKFGFDRMNTLQLFNKSHLARNFTQTKANELIRVGQKINFENKIVIIGRVDEFSYFAGENPLTLFSQPIVGSTMKKAFSPSHHILANQINTFLTGDYLKHLNGKIIYWLVYLFLLLIIFFKADAKLKLLLFTLLLPILITFQSLVYITSSMYFDLNNLYALIFFVQYIGIPIISFVIFKELKSKQLEEINNARIDALISLSEKVAHDIRSPLSAMNLLIGRTTFNSEEQKKIFSESINRIETLTENLLTKYKSITNEMPIHNLEYVTPEQLTASLLAEKKIITPLINYSTNFPDNLNFSTNRLELLRILSNLIDNSIHAVKNTKNPLIIISFLKLSDGIEITVEDNGSGIPESVIKILGNERFTTKSSGSGNGIGLLHAKRSLEQFGGTLNINSTESKFTRVSIKLPQQY